MKDCNKWWSPQQCADCACHEDPENPTNSFQWQPNGWMGCGFCLYWTCDDEETPCTNGRKYWEGNAHCQPPAGWTRIDHSVEIKRMQCEPS